MVSSELARVHDRVRFLESEMKAQQTRGLSDPGALDEETIAALVGEETARVLAVAREAAQQIRAHAADEAERTLRDAEYEARRVREEAMLDAVRKRSDLDSQIEAELELAKQQGRDMVVEARRFRDDAVSDATIRRDQVKAQIGHLVHLRDRLVEAFERARLAAELAVGDLAEFDELADAIVEITGGPDQEPRFDLDAFNPLPRRDEANEPTGEILFFDHAKVPDAIPQRKEPPVAARVPVDATPIMGVPFGFDVVERTERARLDGGDHTSPTERGVSGHEPPSSQDSEAPFAPTVNTSMASHPSVDHAESGRMADVVPLFDRGRRPTPVSEPPVSESAPAVTNPAIDSLFARLRTSSTERVAAAVGAEPSRAAGSCDTAASDATVPPGDAGAPVTTRSSRGAVKRRPSLFSGSSSIEPTASTTPSATPGGDEPSEVQPVAVATVTVDPARFAEREVAIEPPRLAIMKKLKRLLADEENTVLTRLQDRKVTVALETLIPGADAQVHAIVADLEEELMRLAIVGATSMPPDGADLGSTIRRSKVLSKVSRRVDEWIVSVLRERLQRCVESSGGDRDAMSSAVRSAYREWKLQRIETIAADLARLAYSRGAYLALADGTRVCWVADPDGPPCADAEDNSLAGAHSRGARFPTGHSHPVAHPGCRCLIEPASN